MTLRFASLAQGRPFEAADGASGDRGSASRKQRVLFLCTGNSCRSQMAEGWARHLRSDDLEPASAGVVAKGLDPRATQVMADAGVDISRQTSKRLDELDGPSFDRVITVCGNAHESCPVFPGPTRVVHIPFDDPPHLAATAASEEQALVHYRRVRDEIRRMIESL